VAENTSEPGFSRLFPFGIAFIFGAHFLTIILIMGLMPLYIILAVKDERHDQTMRIVWVVLFCTMGMFAIPVYWYLYIWRKPQVRELSNPL
jgi:Ca2+/Na+ antiporter